MAELPTDDDLMHQHTLNVEDLISDSDFGSGPMSGFGKKNIWSNCTTGVDFLPYSNGYSAECSNGNGQWPLYAGTGAPKQDTVYLSSQESDAGSSDNGGWRYDMAGNGLNRDALSEALAQWSQEYDPFKSSSVIDDLDEVSGVVRDKSPLRRSQSANSRPTFADVAKKPSSPGSEPPSTPSLSNDGPVYGSQDSLNSQQDKKAKAKAFRPAHPRHGSYHVPLPINPDSKYGLDDFPQDSNVGKMERSYSCNDALGCSSPNSKNNLDNFVDEELGSGDKVPSVPSSKTGREWFDPKRIFMNGSTRGRSESEPGSEPVLNNAPDRGQHAAKSNGRRGTASYINNLHDDCHRASKQTNADRVKPAMNGNGTANGSAVASDQVTDDECDGTTSAAGYYVSGSIRLAKVILAELLSYLLLGIMFVIGITTQTVYYISHHASVLVTKTFMYLAVKVGFNSGTPEEWNDNPFIKNTEHYGWETNIKLPETSEEAMRRLLTCRGKDAYSILGLSCEATDEEIRRYYRRQAVLVHPDKNQQAGAEEAFKILSTAFELIGTPENRKIYDTKIENEKWSEEVRMHTEDLLEKLKEKYEEASKWLHCSKCDSRHRRYITEKTVYKARKCNRCETYHAVKEGEVWAETVFMGFKWHFYACMDNRVYEVTDWVACQGLSNRISPNAHAVSVKISTSGNGSAPPSGFRDTAGMENLETLIKNLFPSQHPTSSHGKSPDSTTKSTSASGRKGKRRTRRR